MSKNTIHWGYQRSKTWKIKSSVQNPPKSQNFVRARVLQCSRWRSASHTKCNCAQIITPLQMYLENTASESNGFWLFFQFCYDLKLRTEDDLCACLLIFSCSWETCDTSARIHPHSTRGQVIWVKNSSSQGHSPLFLWWLRDRKTCRLLLAFLSFLWATRCKIDK